MAILLLIFALAISQLTSEPAWSTLVDLTIACSLLFFAIGFLIWLIQTINRFWKSGLGKLAIGLTNGLVLLLSVRPARMIVSKSIGLSPLDFDYTSATFKPPMLSLRRGSCLPTFGM